MNTESQSNTTAGRVSSRRFPLGLAAALFLAFPLLAAAADNPGPSPKEIAQALQTTGQISVKKVGDLVHVGSYRIWVSSKLGRPDHTLPDGTWLYKDFSVDDTEVKGTLVVNFDNGQVSKMTLVTPEVAMALLSPASKPGKGAIASAHIP